MMIGEKSDMIQHQETYYHENSRRRDLDDFKEELRQLSPSCLIEKIVKYENDIQQHQDLIRSYDRNIRYTNTITNRNKALDAIVNDGNSKEITIEKAILAKKFDDALRK